MDVTKCVIAETVLDLGVVTVWDTPNIELSLCPHRSTLALAFGESPVCSECREADTGADPDAWADHLASRMTSGSRSVARVGPGPRSRGIGRD